VLDGACATAGLVSSFMCKALWCPGAREKRESWEQTSPGHWSVGAWCIAGTGRSSGWGHFGERGVRERERKQDWQDFALGDKQILQTS
jgi:hypothetical protein